MTKKEVIVPADDLVCLGKDTLQELIRCKDCKYNSNTEGNYVSCDIIPQMFGKTPDNNYCSWAELKDTTEEVRKQLKDMEQRREMDRKK